MLFPNRSVKIVSVLGTSERYYNVSVTDALQYIITPGIPVGEHPFNAVLLHRGDWLLRFPW